MKILLVEDSKLVQMAVKEMLSESGVEVETCENGKLAVEYFQKSDDIDIILLDWNMPEMTGEEFLIYNQENKITKAQIIMMTTENKPEKIMRACSLGASEYVMKPFDKDIIKEKISMVVNG